MKKVIISGVIVIALFIFLTKIIIPDKDEAVLGVGDRKVYSVGALVILSGEAATWGENAKHGIDLAVEEINSSDKFNNIQIDIIYEDTHGEAKNAVSAYHKLININKVDAIIGPLYQVSTAAISPLVELNSIPAVAPSYAHPDNRPNLSNPLMVWIDPTQEAYRMAEYVWGQNIKTISIIGTRDAWEQQVSTAFAERYTQLGGEVLFQELVQPETLDIKSTVTKALQNDPEAVFIGTFWQFVPTVQKIKEMRYDKPLYSIEVDGYLAGETRGLSDGLRFVAPNFYNDEFVEKFKDKYGQTPGIPAGQAYDATYILASLLKDNKTNEEIIQAMSDIKHYDGVSGEMVINENSEVLFPTAIYEVQNGEIIKIN